MELLTTLTILALSIVAAAVVGKVIYVLLRVQDRQLIEETQSVAPEINEPLETVDDEEEEKSDRVLDQFDELDLTRRIYELLVVEEIYKQQGLTVGEFAKKLRVPSRIVTQIFEKLYGHTFKELTNMYRVEYAKQRIEEGYLELYTLDALGKEAGFSSRTTFFNVFKKEIGICPSEYWKNYLAEAA